MKGFFRRSWSPAVSLLLFFLSVPGWAGEPPLVLDIVVSQVDYYQDGELVVPDSEWGELTAVSTPGHDLAWLNVVTHPATALASWSIQNLPLIPIAQGDDFLVIGSQYFPLNVMRGSNVTGASLPLAFTVTPTPLTAPPLDGSRLTAVIDRSRNIVNSGVPTIEFDLNPPRHEPVDWTGLDPLDEKVTIRTGMPNVVQERNFCGPGAAANSLHWLYRLEDVPFGQTLEQTQSELADNMGNENTGNWDDTEVQGKLEFIADHRLELEVHYTGGVKLPTAGNYVDPNGHGFARNDGAITCEWLANEMMMGQDIELMTDTHWVVIESIISWGEGHPCLIEYRDDPFQRGAATTAAQRAVIADRHVWTRFDPATGRINIGNGEEILRTAVAESRPVIVFGDGFESGDVSAWTIKNR